MRTRTVVAKFGGSSLADPGQIKKVVRIINSNTDRRIIVVSAPGKRFPDDEKITDVLYRWHALARSKVESDDIAREASERFFALKHFIEERYLNIVEHFDLNLNVGAEVGEFTQRLLDGASVEYVASRGEYLMGKILAELLGFEFIDPSKYIYILRDGSYELDSSFSTLLKNTKGAVVAGFYGSDLVGEIKTFSRGGSDITGAIVASAVGADVYENWTDVSGILTADPRVVENPKTIRHISYGELRELTYMGANVFHEEAMFPVQDAGIPTNIKNTNCPADEGTWIMPDNGYAVDSPVCGIAGRKDFSVIQVKKRLMNKEIGFGRKILSVLERRGMRFEHMPGGIDTMSVIVDSRELNGSSDAVLAEIQETCGTPHVEIESGLAMIAIVGQGMVHNVGIAARVLSAIADAGINTKVINQGSSEMSIIIGVENADCEETIRALYKTFNS